MSKENYQRTHINQSYNAHFSAVLYADGTCRPLNIFAKKLAQCHGLIYALKNISLNVQGLLLLSLFRKELFKISPKTTCKLCF